MLHEIGGKGKIGSLRSVRNRKMASMRSVGMEKWAP